MTWPLRSLLRLSVLSSVLVSALLFSYTPVLHAAPATAASPAETASPAAGRPAVQRLQGTAAAAKMRSLLGNRPTMQAQFTQTVTDARGAIIQRSAGTFTARQPRQLHWQVQSPAEQLLITDGKQIWLYDPDLQQVTIDALDAATADAPMLVLSGHVDALLDRFTLTGEGTGDSWTFQLRVRNPNGNRGTGFQSIAVRLARGDVQSMLVQDALAQRTELNFSRIRHPRQVDARLFKFIIPAGTEIVQR